MIPDSNKIGNDESLFGHRVKVYWNVTADTFSVVDMNTESPNYGHVIGYADKIYLKDVKFRVSKKGVDRIRSQGQKSVVAYALGFVCSPDGITKDRPYELKQLKGVRFDPHTMYKFHTTDGEPIKGCDFLVLERVRNSPELIAVRPTYA